MTSPSSPSPSQPPTAPASARRLTPVAALVAAATLGGAVAVGGTWLLGGFDNQTTIVQQEASSGSTTRPIAEGGLTVHQIYERSAPAVVQITSTLAGGTSPDGFATPASQALGSGFVTDKDGHIVTNFHVVENAEKIQVSFSNHETVDATLVGSDPATDLAVLKVELPASALAPLGLADSDRVEVGEPVVAIGNPFGLERTVTAGIVSAVQRNVTSPSGSTIDHIIQTDAPINHGNSGGPLLDSQGRVIGVNSQIETGGSGDGNVGIGFAVPSNTVKTVVAQLLANGKVERAFLGVAARPITPQLAKTFNLPVDHGLLVESVTAGTGAAKAHLRAGDEDVVVEGESYRLGGDLIVSADGKQVKTVADLRDVVTAHKPGETITVELYRDGAKQTVTVTLGQQPETLTS
jgi:S1-C subfamily serine protease